MQWNFSFCFNEVSATVSWVFVFSCGIEELLNFPLFFFLPPSCRDELDRTKFTFEDWEGEEVYLLEEIVSWMRTGEIPLD